jgi:hypothetical protein
MTTNEGRRVSEAAASRRRGRQLAIAVAVSAMTTFLTLGVCELALRALRPMPTSIYEPDETRLYRLVPNVVGEYRREPINGGQRMIWHTNSEGFRGPELLATGTHTRVMVYGDSMVEGAFSVEADTFTAQLASRLQHALGRPVEGVNAGVSGYGPDQVSLRLPVELRKYRPDLAVFVIFADNDFGDIVRNRLYRLDANGALVAGNSTLAPVFRETLEQESHPQGLRRLHLVRLLRRARAQLQLQARSARETRQFDYIADSLRRSAAAFAKYEAGDIYVTQTDALGDHYDADLATDPQSPSARLKVRLMEGVIAKIRDECLAANVPMFLLVVPSPTDACDNYDASVDPVKYPQYDRVRLSSAVENAAQLAGIAHLNLFPILRARDANEYYFHGRDDHWNERGQALAATLASEAIVEHSLLSRRK